MSRATAIRGICIIFLLILLSSVSIPSKTTSTPVQHKLGSLSAEPENLEVELPGFSFYEIGYAQPAIHTFVGDTAILDDSSSCSLQIFCRPTGFTNPSLHCYIITNDIRQTQPVFAKFTAGPDPKKRGNIASWRVEPLKAPVSDIQCIQCMESNRIPCLKIDCLRSLTKEFNDTRFKYDFRAQKGPNSNSFVTGILKKCGLSYSAVNFAAGANGYEYVFN